MHAACAMSQWLQTDDSRFCHYQVEPANLEADSCTARARKGTDPVSLPMAGIAGTYSQVTGFPSVTHASQDSRPPELCSMKRTNIIYWAATALLALQTAMAGIMYFTNPEVAIGFGHLGFPDYFRQELGIAKLIAALVVILPMVPLRMKEWAYVGLAITFLSAFIAHTAVDGASTGIAPLVSLVLLVVSYIYLHKRVGTKPVVLTELAQG